MSFLGSIAGAVVGGLFGQHSANQSANAQAALNKETMAWQERMSNTAHQREVKDMRAAGLNPILSATGGSGASSPTPVVSAYTGYGQDSASGINAGTQAFNAFTGAKAQKAQQALYMEQMNNLRANTGKTNAEADTARAFAESARMRNLLELGKLFGETQNLQSQTNLNKANQEYTSGALTRLTSAKETNVTEGTKLIQAQTLLTNAQRWSILTLTPYQAQELQAQAIESASAATRNLTQADLNKAQTVLIDYQEGKISAETANLRLQGVGLSHDNAIKAVNATTAKIELKRKQVDDRYSGVEPTDAYEYIQRGLGNVFNLPGIGFISKLLK